MSGEVQASLEDRAKKFLPLSPTAWYVLTALLEGPRHAYGVTKRVDELSQGEVRLGTGSIYQYMSRYVSSGLIKESQRAQPLKTRRRNYQVTPLGFAVVGAEIKRIERMLRAVDRHANEM